MMYIKKGYRNAGKDNPNWKGGKPKCISCKVDLVSYQSKRCRSCYHKSHTAEKAYQWTENPSYRGIHTWVNRKFKRLDKCENCHNNPGLGKDGRTKLQWANISKKYLRDRADWYCLCTKCHCLFDKNWLKRKRDNEGNFI